MGRGFQFSIRLLLIATAAIGAAVAAVAAETSWKSCLALEFLGILFASIAILAACKSHGALRVFWIAATVPATGGAAIYFFYGCVAGGSSMLTEPADTLVMILGGLRIALPVIWCLSLANGVACALVWSAIRSGKDDPEEPRTNDGRHSTDTRSHG
ncbi:MAG TPA: hypothetical protein VHC22_30245 [Pirellulales bacterium]|nr:hypothetical protein [Pirellulales bacterium]